MKMTLLILVLLCAVPLVSLAQSEESKVATFDNVTITPVVHASMMLQWNELIIHVDPWSRGDYNGLPKADIMLITHEHGDHLDPEMIAKLKKTDTWVLGPKTVADKLAGVEIISNGELKVYNEHISVTAFPAYNLIRERSEGVKYHPKGGGNGYLLNFDGTKIYIAGDTENVPELAGLIDVDVAFLPCNLPYTMTPEEFVAAAKVIMPKVLYIYHYGQTDLERVKELMKAVPGVELRVF